ncbi:unnamed protein product [Auanema sp. JU1783]|nr:unnamed protein product [Auanema sp. JU1783]
MPSMAETKTISRDVDTTLSRLLIAADLEKYENKLRDSLKLRNANDLQYTEEQDLSGIGMSRPEQKRLRKEYDKMFNSGFVGKLKKVFGRNEPGDRKDSASAQDDDEDQHVILPEKISLCKELGCGEFGSVWQATWKGGVSGTDMQVAVKCISPEKMLTSSTSFLQEASIMSRMKDENVVRLYGVVLDTKRTMLVSELAAYGSLLECLHKPALRDSFPVNVLCDYAEQIAKGMSYLESQRLIHRDLAARNVLVFSPKKVKISDFGLSRSLGVGEDYYRSEFSPSLKLPIAWCAPECINFLRFTSASDVWAYGVTLWELFTYGDMPWNGLNGAEILHAVDIKKKCLPRPTICPEDIYETMKECWTHSYTERPTFALIVSQFPDRLPQTLRSVSDVRDGVFDHLQFSKNDLITVIDKTPSTYPDGFYWYGSLSNGQTGLFKPTDTVAYLGAEIPSNNTVLMPSCMPSGGGEKGEKEKKNSKKSKLEAREKKKALISEPVGEVRHTCHVGIDGTAFGLLQLDKKELVPPPISPSTTRSNTVNFRPGVLRDGVSLKETMSLRDIALSEPTSPPQIRAPSQPGTLKFGVKSHSNLSHSDNSSGSVQKEIQDMFDELDYSIRSLEQTNLAFEDTSSSLPKKRTGPVSAVYARTPNAGLHGTTNASDCRLESEVQNLERDLTDFSLSTFDFSETRPLLQSSQETRTKRVSPIKQSVTEVRMMTNDELGRWKEKQIKEHKRAESVLSQGKFQESNLSKGQDKNTISPPASSLDMEWSPEAQEAYKLLVECGASLKSTPSPAPSLNNTLEKNKNNKNKFPVDSKVSPPPRPVTPTKEDLVESVTSFSPQKKVHIVETKLLNGPVRDLIPTIEDTLNKSPPGLPPKGEVRSPPTLPPKMRNVPMTVDGRINYDNLNGIGAGRCPPPVPPKPKVTFQTSPPPSNKTIEKVSPGFASSIARSTLFTASKTEEIVKF